MAIKGKKIPIKKGIEKVKREIERERERDKSHTKVVFFFKCKCSSTNLRRELNNNLLPFVV